MASPKRNSAMHRSPLTRSFAAAFTVLALLLTGCSRAPAKFEGEMQRQAPWDPELVATMGALPVQDNGRIKPLSTFASFLLYAVHGRRDMKFMIGEERYKLDPMEWILDVWCYPDQAADYPLFRIENVGVLDALRIENEGQTQGFVYLTYRELLENSEELGRLARQYSELDRATRNAVQEHLVQSWRQLNAYHVAHQQLGVLHHDFLVEGQQLQQAFGGERVRLGSIVANAKEFRELVRSVGGQNIETDERLGNAVDIMDTLGRLVDQGGGGPGLLPPLDAGAEQWLDFGPAVDRALRGQIDDRHVQMFTALQSAVAAAPSDPAARDAGLRGFFAASTAVAGARADSAALETEAKYYRSQYHYLALHFFITAFLVAAISWFVPRAKWVWWLSFGLSVIGLSLLTYDIYLRCIITGRPPIKNLYDTFLFIAAVVVAVTLAVECIVRYRIALALAPLGGALLIMLARMFEVNDGKDTMDPLVAVLDSNYWLATHVTMINVGYGTALVGGVLLSTAYIVIQFLRLEDQTATKLVARFIYGVTCFSLLFTVVGTIYGGVWANDSWGRFWGWDPKENGALMICLSQIAMLHARFSGMIRDFGVAMWALVTSGIVVFSWMHTNLLGVGLHNYGFSSALLDGVWYSYSTIGLLMVVGTIHYVIRQGWQTGSKKDAPPPLPESA